MWFREEKANWVISTECVERTKEYVIFKAIISDENNQVKCMAHKVEHYSHFQDALEKAETGAIGRALALIGYGTLFALELSEEDRIVDSPIDSTKKNIEEPKVTQQQTTQKPVNFAPGSSQQGSELSQAQVKRFWAIIYKLGWSNEDAFTALKQKYKKDKPESLSKNEYKEFTDDLEKQLRQPRKDEIPF